MEATMVARKKTDVIQLSKIRMREALRAKLARDAEKKGITLNAEIVDRLEQSYEKAVRDSAIIDMLVRNNDVGSQLLRDIADEIAKHPDWSNSEAGRKDLILWLRLAAHGKEPPEEPRPGEEL
jgi:Arc-like DNA binding domain